MLERRARNYRARVAYEGTRYAGFQVQVDALTVQGEIERALAQITGETIRIAGAGRTDAGVHATGQVVSFRTATELDGQRLGRGVNALLPADIAISAPEPVDDEFHARFSATGRTYEYRIRTGPRRDPLERHREHWLAGALDRDALRAATEHLVGRREFSAFAAGDGGVREVRRAAWTEAGDVLRLEISADAFLRGMVRAIVGTLIWVGTGKIGPDDFRAVVASGRRDLAGPSAPAKGLCLIDVEYRERTSEDGRVRIEESDE